MLIQDNMKACKEILNNKNLSEEEKIKAIQDLKDNTQTEEEKEDSKNILLD